MRVLCVLVTVAALAGCTASPDDDPAARAPSNTITPYASTEPPRPTEEVARDNREIAAAAIPTNVPGLTPAKPKQAVLTLCPSQTSPVPADVVHAYGAWKGADRTLAVTAVLDPANAPADQLLATLLPQDCPSDVDGTHYVFDRQPIERPDGWTGALNTILATDTRTGKHSYTAAYLLSKGDALVNVVAARTNRTTYDPSVDEQAADALEQVLERFAV